MKIDRRVGNEQKVDFELKGASDESNVELVADGLELVESNVVKESNLDNVKRKAVNSSNKLPSFTVSTNPSDDLDVIDEVKEIRDDLFSIARDLITRMQGENIKATPFNLKTVVDIALNLDKYAALKAAGDSRGDGSKGRILEITERKATLILEDVKNLEDIDASDLSRSIEDEYNK
jgi:hypothetical protein